MMRIVCLVLALAACREVYKDHGTGYSVRYNQRYHRGIGLSFLGVIPMDGDRGEVGHINPAVLEYLFAAPESPYARYYDLVLALDDKPSSVALDLRALEAEAHKHLAPGTPARGRDYARALGRKLARPINEALVIRGSRFDGTAGVYWGMPVNLDAGIPLLDYERDGEEQMSMTIVRYQSVGLIVIHSSALQTMLAWDVSKVPGAFNYDAALDQPTIAAHIVALHPSQP